MAVVAWRLVQTYRVADFKIGRTTEYYGTRPYRRFRVSLGRLLTLNRRGGLESDLINPRTAECARPNLNGIPLPPIMIIGVAPGSDDMAMRTEIQ